MCARKNRTAKEIYEGIRTVVGKVNSSNFHLLNGILIFSNHIHISYVFFILPYQKLCDMGYGVAVETASLNCLGMSRDSSCEYSYAKILTHISQGTSSLRRILTRSHLQESCLDTYVSVTHDSRNDTHGITLRTRIIQ